MKPQISQEIINLATEVGIKLDFSLSEILEKIERYAYQLIAESPELKKELLALFLIEQQFKRRFKRAALRECFDFISLDGKIVVEVVNRDVSYSNYATQNIRKLVHLLSLRRKGRQVFIFFWRKKNYEITDLDTLLITLDEITLNRILESSKIHLSPGRRPVEIPIDIVRTMLSEGKSLKEIHQALVRKGFLRYIEKGREKILGYKQFVYRLNALGIRRKPIRKRATIPPLLYDQKRIMKLYQEFKREERRGNLRLFMSFLAARGVIPEEMIRSKDILKRLKIILREQST